MSMALTEIELTSRVLWSELLNDDVLAGKLVDVLMVLRSLSTLQMGRALTEVQEEVRRASAVIEVVIPGAAVRQETTGKLKNIRNILALLKALRESMPCPNGRVLVSKTEED